MGPGCCMHCMHCVRCGAVTVHARLRELIVSGTLVPETQLSEAGLAARLSVSRTPVREALQRLAADGLMHEAGRGVRVRTLSGEELRSAYRVRAALEALVAETAAERWGMGRIPPAALDDLAELAGRADAATRAGDHAAAATLNRAFHHDVAVAADNPVALEQLDRLWDRIIITTRRSLAAPARVEQVDHEHRALLDRIHAADPLGAAAAARDHVLATLEALS
jgi:DNA-binding GntR family transcriptional regulator